MGPSELNPSHILSAFSCLIIIPWAVTLICSSHFFIYLFVYTYPVLSHWVHPWKTLASSFLLPQDLLHLIWCYILKEAIPQNRLTHLLWSLFLSCHWHKIQTPIIIHGNPLTHFTGNHTCGSSKAVLSQQNQAESKASVGCQQAPIL